LSRPPQNRHRWAAAAAGLPDGYPRTGWTFMPGATASSRRATACGSTTERTRASGIRDGGATLPRSAFAPDPPRPGGGRTRYVQRNAWLRIARKRDRGMVTYALQAWEEHNRMSFAKPWQIGGMLSLAAGLLVGGSAVVRPAEPAPAATLDTSAWIMNY